MPRWQRLVVTSGIIVRLSLGNRTNDDNTRTKRATEKIRKFENPDQSVILWQHFVRTDVKQSTAGVLRP
jgi:hypothetical protein